VLDKNKRMGLMLLILFGLIGFTFFYMAQLPGPVPVNTRGSTTIKVPPLQAHPSPSSAQVASSVRNVSSSRPRRRCVVL
jgi:hypothetical protein